MNTIQPVQRSQNETVLLNPRLADNPVAIEPALQEIGSDWYNLKQALYFHGICKNADKNEYQLEVIRQLLCFQDLLEDSADFIYAYHIAKNAKRAGENPWKWQVLADDGILTVALLTVFEDYATPLHDYPGQSGATLSLTGTINISQFDAITSEISASYPIVKLRAINVGTQSKGQISFYKPNKCNIHEFQACTERCVLLVASVKCEQASNRFWYFPISPRDDGKSGFFTQRLKRHW